MVVLNFIELIPVLTNPVHPLSTSHPNPLSLQAQGHLILQNVFSSASKTAWSISFNTLQRRKIQVSLEIQLLNYDHL